jgi:hypothetical protein
MATWSTLHIFGFGETQLIGKDFNKKVLTSELTNVQAVVDNLYSFKPEDIEATVNYQAITFTKTFNGVWVTKELNRWITPYAALDATAIEELVAEIEAYGEVTEEVVSEETAVEETPATEEVVVEETTVEAPVTEEAPTSEESSTAE